MTRVPSTSPFTLKLVPGLSMTYPLGSITPAPAAIIKIARKIHPAGFFLLGEVSKKVIA